MGDVVNLRRFRKARLRAEQDAAAAANRARSGRRIDERQASEFAASRLNASLDGHRREPPATSLDPPGDD